MPILLVRTPAGGLRLWRGPGDYTGRGGVVDAMASFTFNIANNRLNSPTHPVQWFHTKTKQIALTIPMLADTGADFSTLDSKHAKTLGINDLKQGVHAQIAGTGGEVENTFYIHPLTFKIGNLQPMPTSVALGRGGGPDVLGRTLALNKYKVEYTKSTIKYTELGTGMAAYAHAKWRRY